MSKTEIEWCKRIEIWWLLRDIKNKGGYKTSTINWGENGSVGITVDIRDPEHSYLKFSYSQTDNCSGEKKNFNYDVKIVTTPCHLGGKRYWFICPLVKNDIPCRKRIGILYKDGDYFGCRDCYNLTYSSRNKTKNGRFSYFSNLFDAEDKLEKIYKKRFNRVYKGKLTKTQKKIDKLQSAKMFAYRDFLNKEKGLPI